MTWGLHHGRYILVGHEPVPEPDLFAWGKWLESADRRVDLSHVGLLRISTVFMGLDHNFDDDGPPLLFETMIFDGDKGGDGDLYMERCSTWEQAEEMHATAIRWAEETYDRASLLLVAPPEEKP